MRGAGAGRGGGAQEGAGAGQGAAASSSGKEAARLHWPQRVRSVGGHQGQHSMNDDTTRPRGAQKVHPLAHTGGQRGGPSISSAPPCDVGCAGPGAAIAANPQVEVAEQVTQTPGSLPPWEGA